MDWPAIWLPDYHVHHWGLINMFNTTMFYFIYNNETYTFDPNLLIPCEEFSPDGQPIPGYGLTLKEHLGMTDAEAAAALLEGNWNVIRFERNQLIALTDWTQGADVPDTIKLAWQPYRQALRDITSQADPLDITWPNKPEE